jgi:hypothetical protein
MNDRDPLMRAALGAAAGLASTFVIQFLRTQTAKALPETVPPIREEPGVYVVEQVEELLPDETREQITEGFEQAAAKSLAMAYGATAGALYGALLADDRSALADGAILGLGVWAVGYLGWLPATDLMPPVQEQETPQVVAPIAQHLVFGLATVAAYKLLQRVS